MSLKAMLAAVAPSVSNEVLGTVVKALDSNELGASLRPWIGSFQEDDAPATHSKSAEAPTSEVAKAALMETIYNSFGEFKRRSVGALAVATGLTSDALLEMIEGNLDFRISEGRESGKTFVSLRGSN